MKLIGIDYGTKRVGVAVSDASGAMAFPKAVFPNNKHLLSDVAALIQKEKADAVVVGESKNMHGEDNAIMNTVRKFADTLARECAIPVYFEPEFYTSHEARRLLRDAPSKRTDGTVDAQAAAVILNSYIMRHAS